MNNQRDEIISKLTDLILEGNCTLFLGSGASANALNLKEEPLKSVVDFTNYMYELCGLEPDSSLSNAVEEYIECKGEPALVDLLKEEYTVSKIQEEHRIIGAQDWKRIYTTNYDDVIENSYLINKKKISSITLSDKPHHYKDKTSLAIHVNGFIGDLSIDKLQCEFKLTEVSYLSDDFKNNDWGMLFRQDMMTSDAIIFIGLSLNYDLDLKRIIYASEENIKKSYFIVRKNESDASIRRISKFGTVIPIGLEEFSQHLDLRKKTFIPPTENIKRQYLCFKRPERITSIPDRRDIDFYNLLVKGDLNYHLLQYAIEYPENYPYFINREKTQAVINQINNGLKNVIVLSDLGNGKTLFLEGLTYALSLQNYNVYKHTKNYASIHRELESICRDVHKPIIIVENYSSYFELLDTIKSLRSDLTLILSERSLVNDLVFNRLEEHIGENYNIIDLNILTDNEIDSLISLLDQSGLWGEYSNLNYYKKTEIIAGDCHKNMRLVLLKLLKSPAIINKFKKSIDTVKERKNFFESITLILISKVFGFPLDLDELVYILDDEVLNKPSFQKNEAINELINFKRGLITVQSSILSEIILSEILQSKGIIDTLIKVCKRLDSRRNDKNTKIIFKSIISFSNLQRILKKDTAEYKFNILRFFEEIRNIKYCENNPHYWLQYAIARLAEREYDLADRYFQNAYSYASKIEWFDSYQIDNHYARYIIENEIINGSQETCMNQFLKAHKILINPNDKNKSRHYPFRVALNYHPFYQKYFNKISSSDQKIFIHSCSEILIKINLYMNSIESYRIKAEVKKTKDIIEQIVEKHTNN